MLKDRVRAASALLDALISAEISVWNRLEHTLSASERATSLCRYFTLRSIDAVGERDAKVNDIARAQRITVGAASRLVDRLVSDGLVDRRASPADRRATSLALTAEGRNRMSASHAPIIDTLEELLARFDDAELAALIRFLERLTDAAERPRA